jgi:hypothetical protein
MRATFQADLEKAKKAIVNAKGTMTAATSQIFTFYANLLSVEAKYTLNKFVEEQMEGNSYVDQGVSQVGPKEKSGKSLNNCVLLHLLTVFPINAAEQEKYYITNLLKKP